MISKITFLLLPCIFTCVFSAVVTSKVKKHQAPTFANNYVVKGVLLLPYAEIKEPFTAYYDLDNKKSRIDYYGDMVKTYQRADQGQYGVSYKLAFMPDALGVPERTCFQVNGTSNSTVTTQSILPDLSSFSYSKDDVCLEYNKDVSEDSCEVWILENAFGDKINHYMMYLKKDSREPVYYLMKGYNSLLGSHYDKYEVYYTYFKSGGATADDFDVDSGIACGAFPGPGVTQMVFNNPMMEFMNNEDGHNFEAFEKFKADHGKSYKSSVEHERRMNIFRQNFRFINSMNRAAHSFALKVNHLADYSDQEMRILRGRLPSKEYNGGAAFPEKEFSKEVPSFVDWRLNGAVTPVKDQAVCGSCWSFGTTGTIEGAYFLKTNRSVRLSQQQLIDCSWQFENNGCDGGEDFRAYKYIISAGGLATEDDYGSYLGEDGICHDSKVKKTVTITGYVNVTSKDLTALKKAIAFKGPISVSIDAAHKTFSFYSHGVYYNPACKSGEDQLDHSVLAVGYGTMNGQDYWIIKNSWSTYWGNDGYVLMSQKDNNCGVATSPTYVIM